MFKRKKKKTGCETPEFRTPIPPSQQVRILIKRDCTSRYEEFDPVLYYHELAVEYDGNQIVGYKLGDGKTKWSELDYITNISDIHHFVLYCDPTGPAAQVVLDPFMANDIQGGTEQ